MNGCHTEGEGAQDASSGPGPAYLNSPRAGGEATLDLGEAARVFDILPTTALELLCVNVEFLARPNVGIVVEPVLAAGSARSDTMSSGEATPTKITELHCSPMSHEEAARDRLQQSMLSKRFLSKRAPPIALRDYLLRLHRYCPMSTAVYLATSIYITRMTTVDRVMSVDSKNMHRLVLAGLRVAMKALEDLSYPHSRIAKVGGVSERELSRLEISFCFLTDFDLRVDAQMLFDQAQSLQSSMDLVLTEMG
ncbi:putative cyclin-dependent protein kinase complex component [Aspergillus clavatus NRRL 1]|uniref:Cyclin-dependent protein kinase complex component (Pcl8), putative n=1 Tax=Aspergillus clavatus (strain ATCC 1007 / CBS 513.65 / DSM 816 / NCTC 3887 / NRRL 1 / QM 1276 / 107) TaxID=344612 RepID=A1CSJ5_ASPCL|nr:cyclin-dependent protein kinase complex component (Pcl8), putative [Aspergillus clavatus NRRL 1]EAW06282.1 cyclin-dependent protein kinase complex component (Pcl8), putative [Aspergillus clavatus NRRL 1]